MFQKWRHLLFLHWAWDPAAVQATLPPGLSVDTYDGRAFIGLVPFFMRDIRPWWAPPVPGLSDFLEVNVRTYVHDAQGRPGVWFYSLDASQPVAVWLARAFFRLPYFHSRMRATVQDGLVDYQCRRRGLSPDEASHFRYRPAGPPNPAEPGGLAFFLVERYRLFAALGGGKLANGRVYHPPYAIGPADVTAWDGRLMTRAGFSPAGRPPDHCLYAPGVDVAVYALVH